MHGINIHNLVGINANTSPAEIADGTTTPLGEFGEILAQKGNGKGKVDGKENIESISLPSKRNFFPNMAKAKDDIELLGHRPTPKIERYVLENKFNKFSHYDSTDPSAKIDVSYSSNREINPSSSNNSGILQIFSKGRKDNQKIENNFHSTLPPVEKEVENNNLHDVLGIKIGNGKENDFSKSSNSITTPSNIISLPSRDDIIGKITNYLIENGIKNSDSLEVWVQHEGLGKFKIDAQRDGTGEHVNLKIETITNEGNTFFKQNEDQLVKELVKSGVKLSEIKIVHLRDSLVASNNPISLDERHMENDTTNERGKDDRGNRDNDESRKRNHFWQNYREEKEDKSA